MIEEGTTAPDFELETDSGEKVRLSSFRGKPVVLYFYPRDNTPGCTKEACGIRDAWSEFERRGAVVLGVSPDNVASHKRFKSKYQLPFTLLADPGHDDRRALRRLAAQAPGRQELPRHRPLDLPDRRRRNGRQGLAEGRSCQARRLGARGVPRAELGAFLEARF